MGFKLKMLKKNHLLFPKKFQARNLFLATVGDTLSYGKSFHDSVSQI